jgi:small-conductance mechanosensitive channel
MIAVLANLGVNVTPLLAGAGVVGLAIGFGAQTLVQDLITGLFIVVEDTIAIGDSIELPDHVGVVEAMTIRTVRLRDGKGAVHTLPYSQIKAVKNLSRGYAFAVFNISIAYQSDFERALELVRETGAEVARDHRYSRNLLSGLDILGLDRFDPTGQVVLAQFKTRPLTQYEITRAFNIRLKRNFDANGIRLAVPFVTVQVDGSGTEEEIATAAAAGAGADLVTRKAGKPA